MANKYLLKGDISGIQEFIFNVSSKKAAKSLKARSFYVQLIGDLALKFIENDISKKGKDFSCEVLYNGGGNFFLNIETSKDIKEQLKEWQKVIDEELLYDEFYVSLAVVENNNNFGDTWKKITQQSNENKLLKFSLSYNNLFSPYSFKNKENSNENQRWFNTTDYIYKGITNKRWATVTDAMVKKGYLKTRIFEEIENKHFEDKFNTIANKLPLWNKKLLKATEKLIDKIVKREKEKDDEYNIPKAGNIIDFTFISEFAKERTGTAKLGILKMDVDDLSKLFRDISDAEEGKKRSEQLGYFFDNYIYEIWNSNYKYPEYSKKEKQELSIPYKNNIYPVFTGGDDCFFIGAWDAILQFANNINKSFSEFANGKIEYKIDNTSYKNEEIKHKNGKSPTLSAGIIIVDEHFPVVQFAELVENAISEAKKNKNSKNKIVKNAISIFGEVFTWNEFDEIIEVSHKLTDLIATEKASKAVLRHIRKSAEGFEKLYLKAKKGNINFPRVDKLRYNLRGAKEEAEHFYKEHIYTKYKISLLNAFDNKEGENPMKYPVATRIAEFSLRNK